MLLQETLDKEIAAEVEYLRDVEKLDQPAIDKWLPVADPVTAGVHAKGPHRV